MRCVGTFALWRVLAAVSEDVDLVYGSVRLEQLLQLLLWPGAWDLAHKHLDGVRVRLVRMLQCPVHLSGCAVTVETDRKQNVTRLLTHVNFCVIFGYTCPPFSQRTQTLLVICKAIQLQKQCKQKLLAAWLWCFTPWCTNVFPNFVLIGSLTRWPQPHCASVWKVIPFYVQWTRRNCNSLKCQSHALLRWKTWPLHTPL